MWQTPPAAAHKAILIMCKKKRRVDPAHDAKAIPQTAAKSCKLYPHARFLQKVVNCLHVHACFPFASNESAYTTIAFYHSFRSRRKRLLGTVRRGLLQRGLHSAHVAFMPFMPRASDSVQSKLDLLRTQGDNC